MRFLLLFVMVAGLARADGERAGDFDYYILSLSWSPNWCALEGAAQGSAQCDRDFGWILHGLWPQYRAGWPSWCRTAERDPSRGETAAMADIMGSAGLAWYQWQKHGRCSGLSSAAYFAAARAAFEAVKRPDILRNLTRDVSLPAALIEEAFLRDNPDWTADMLTITCKAGHVQEARLCLTSDLDPRVCGADVRRDCALADALFLAR